MPRLNLSHLPLPDEKYRLDLLGAGSKGFETEDAARSEDRRRAKLLRASAESATKPNNQVAARSLADKLDYDDAPAPASLASALAMRHYRLCTGGAFLRLFDQHGDLEQVTFHLTGKKLEIPAPELSGFSPIRACRQLRADLDLGKVSAARGGFFAYLDSEYIPALDMFRMHFHGFAIGEKAKALEALRKFRKYESARYRGCEGRSVQRLRVTRKLTDLPSHLPYLVKSFWPCRWEGTIDGQPARSPRRSRLPEPRHSQMLLWFDRWRLNDLAVLNGLEVGQDGLRLTRKDG